MLVGMSQVNFWRSIYLLDATLALASFKLSNHIILSTMHFRSCLSFGGLAEQLQELQNCSEPIGDVRESDLKFSNCSREYSSIFPAYTISSIALFLPQISIIMSYEEEVSQSIDYISKENLQDTVTKTNSFSNSNDRKSFLVLAKRKKRCLILMEIKVKTSQPFVCIVFLLYLTVYISLR